jgi:hypothetical protein
VAASRPDEGVREIALQEVVPLDAVSRYDSLAREASPYVVPKWG